MAMDYARSFYSSKAWRDCRDSFMLSKNGICERCEGMAYIVHHKEHISPTSINDPNVTLSWDNLEALCLTCHNITHGDGEPVRADVMFDSQGQLIKKLYS